MSWQHFWLHFHIIPEHRVGQPRPLIHHESCRSLLKMWIVLIYLHWSKCSREETLLLTLRMLAKVLAAWPFNFPLSITPSILESSVIQGSTFKQMFQKAAGDVRVLLGFAEDLIAPQWQCWLAEVLVLSTLVPQVAFGLPFLSYDWC